MDHAEADLHGHRAVVVAELAAVDGEAVLVSVGIEVLDGAGDEGSAGRSVDLGDFCHENASRDCSRLACSICRDQAVIRKIRLRPCMNCLQRPYRARSRSVSWMQSRASESLFTPACSRMALTTSPSGWPRSSPVETS